MRRHARGPQPCGDTLRERQKLAARDDGRHRSRCNQDQERERGAPYFATRPQIAAAVVKQPALDLVTDEAPSPAELPARQIPSRRPANNRLARDGRKRSELVRRQQVLAVNPPGRVPRLIGLVGRIRRGVAFASVRAGRGRPRKCLHPRPWRPCATRRARCGRNPTQDPRVCGPHSFSSLNPGFPREFAKPRIHGSQAPSIGSRSLQRSLTSE